MISSTSATRLVKWPIGTRTGAFTSHLWCKRGSFSVFFLLPTLCCGPASLEKTAETVSMVPFPPFCHWLLMRSSGGVTSHLQSKPPLCGSRPVVASQLSGTPREDPKLRGSCERWVGVLCQGWLVTTLLGGPMEEC